MILSCSNIDKTFTDNHVIKNASFHIEDYEKAAIVGINGAGKSTLLKIIVGKLPADTGLVTFAKDKSFGYLAQHQAVDSENTLFDELLTVKQEVLDLESAMRQCELDMKNADGNALELLLKKYTNLTHRFEDINGYAYKSEITGILKGLGFGEDEFDKKVATLSGGQKTRIALGKLLLQKPDLIMLDEPTNHLDITSKEILESALNAYEGTVLYVSHDRYFINKTASRILELTHQEFVNYIGNYDYYLEKREILTPVSVLEAAAAEEVSTQKLDWKQQKETQAQARKKENDLKKCEARIEELEQKSASLDTEMAKPENATNSAKLQELSKEKETVCNELEELYEKWEALSE